METKTSSFFTHLFQPFRYIAGGKSLLYGLAILLLLTFLSCRGNIYFDGVLDIHAGSADNPASFTVYAYCVFIPWFISVLVFYLTALVFSGKLTRIVDMAGTLALAKMPMIPAAFLGFIPAVHYTPDLNPSDLTGLINFIQKNIFWILILLIVFITVTIGSLVWMYNAYSVSGNLKGIKGIVSFIIALLISEILAKIILIQLI